MENEYGYSLAMKWTTEIHNDTNLKSILSEKCHMQNIVLSDSILKTANLQVTESRQWLPETEGRERTSAIDWMFAHPPNSYAEVLIPNVTVLGGSTFGR